ncbi:hypothetical protein HC864_03870 [Candidatus Gracilibacteria bacterium]|nr:hypothetical protein [Candidatus Gracilibacteria bacterium]
MGDPNSSRNSENQELIDFDVTPLIVGRTTKNIDVVQVDFRNLENDYIDKLNIDAGFPLELGLLKFDNPNLDKVILFRDGNTGKINLPTRIVSSLYEFDYSGVKYWLFVDGSDGTLYISLENFENPRQISVAGQTVVPFGIKQVKEQSKIFWMNIGNGRSRKLVKLDFEKIPLAKWDELDFLLEVSNSDNIEKNFDLNLLNTQLKDYLRTIEDQIGLEFFFDFRFFDYYVTENDKVLIQVPGISNQFVLLNGNNTLLVKLDADFSVGDGLITCENEDNVCIVYYPNVGIYRIDVSGDEPVADNISPTIVDKGDGGFDATLNRVWEEFGYDTEKLLDYEDDQVIIGLMEVSSYLVSLTNKTVYVIQE